MLAIRALSNHNPELLARLHGTVIKILRDPDDTIVKAALTVATCISKARQLLSGLAMPDQIPNKDTTVSLKVRTTVNNILKSKSSYVGESSQWFIFEVLNCLNTVGFVIRFNLILTSLVFMATL